MEYDVGGIKPTVSYGVQVWQGNLTAEVLGGF